MLVVLILCTAQTRSYPPAPLTHSHGCRGSGLSCQIEDNVRESVSMSNDPQILARSRPELRQTTCDHCLALCAIWLCSPGSHGDFIHIRLLNSRVMSSTSQAKYNFHVYLTNFHCRLHGHWSFGSVSARLLKRTFRPKRL